jgi:hypothetical protein
MVHPICDHLCVGGGSYYVQSCAFSETVLKFEVQYICKIYFLDETIFVVTVLIFS